MPNFPYIILVTVRDVSNSLVSGITVTSYNETTGEVITANTTTDANGQTLIDLNNMNEGYSDDDYVQITASGSGDTGEVLKFKAVCKTDFSQINQADINYEI